MPTNNPIGRRPMVRLGLALLVSWLLVPLTAVAAPAGDEPGEGPAADGGFAVQPSGPEGPGARDWFTYTLDPGDVFGDTVAISNLGDEPKTFHIYATDAVSVADVGGFSAIRDDEKAVDVGTWIELGVDEYTVAPGKRIDVPFRITVPEDAEPGDHAGAILAIDTAQLDPSNQDGISLDVIQRLGSRVYVRVGGDAAAALEIENLEIDRNGSDATLTWEIVNSGNLRLSPSVNVKITGFLGRTVRTLPAQQLPELLPGANFVGGSALTGLPEHERLTAHLVVKAEGVEVERSLGFGTYPWPVIVGLVIALLIIGWAWRRRRVRRRRAAGPPAAPERRVPVPV